MVKFLFILLFNFCIGSFIYILCADFNLLRGIKNSERSRLKKIRKENEKLLKMAHKNKVTPKTLAQLRVGDFIYLISESDFISKLKQMNEKTVMVDYTHSFIVERVLCRKITNIDENYFDCRGKKYLVSNKNDFIGRDGNYIFSSSLRMLEIFLSKMETDSKKAYLNDLRNGMYEGSPELVAKWVDTIKDTNLSIFN